MAEKQPEPRRVSNDVAQKAAKLYQEQGDLQDTLVNLEIKIQEHKVVLASLEKLEPERRCFRRMAGVLIERTVGQVRPAIKDHLEKLQGFQKGAADSFNRKSEELQAFTKEHQITIKHPSETRSR